MHRQVIMGGLVAFSFFMACINPALAFECTPVNKPKLWRAQAPVPAKPFKAEPNPERQKALQKMKGKLPKKMNVSETWNLKTGLPLELRFGGNISTPRLSKPDPVEIANQFLKDWQDALGIDVSQLSAPVVQKREFDFSLGYYQAYQGVPVLWGGGGGDKAGIGLIVLVDYINDIWYSAITIVHSDYYPNINLSTTPKITAEKAIQSVEECIGQSLNKEPISGKPMVSMTTLVILPDCDVNDVPMPCEYFLAWYVPHAYYVDALTGKIIKKAYVLMN